MKNKFNIHDIDSAPEASSQRLANYKKQNGMIPNLFGVMAEAPGLLEGYQKLHQLFLDSSFNDEEKTVVWQSINVEHNCTYCVPAHTAIAHMMKVDPALTEALRNQQPLPTEKLQVLQETTLALVRKRGELSEAEVEKFYAAGYGQRQLLEIILGLSQKVMSNYVNHLAGTPSDEAFRKFAWQK
ncbi:carboxymuconolactone decarboxylase family protein [Pelovirga terrestris]|uniref:Carboxymuconolactone decarboxylase family protein n=1 Tax=Pelovirga terrestris TaxID=2771352 RepID=A0A8J6QQX0_9BACT|nr:carboxymuconolactone decarboxylase family protein [Pelovirga terrestris]MBD1401606.1 carboxymuconolactone decarboxylase family protein [Pelovirga terrestris]